MCRTNQYFVSNKDKKATTQMNLKQLNLMLFKSTTQMNKSKSGYTRTTGIMQGSIKATEIETVRLNLINHVLALFHDKFACNTALRNHVFRWKSCKGSV